MWFALWIRSDTGLFRTSSPPLTSAGRHDPKLYCVFKNYTGFVGVFFFTDGVMNYSRSLVLVGLTIRGSEKVVPTCEPAKNWFVFSPAADTVYLRVSSLSSAMTPVDNMRLQLLLLYL